MQSKRPAVLMAILLALVLGYVSQPWWQTLLLPNHSKVTNAQQPPLPGTNSISGLTAQMSDAGVWTASFDYYYTGSPPIWYMRVDLARDIPAVDGLKPGRPSSTMVTTGVTRGKHHVDIEILHPGDDHRTTKVVAAQMFSDGKVVASQVIEQGIDWPSWSSWLESRNQAKKSPDDLLTEAVALIDTGEERELAAAKLILERLVNRNPRFDAAYVELARVAMKTNWGPEGLHQAESLIASAQQINPDSANAKILMGYVHAHQKRYREAEILFEQASQTDTRNLWLWANWGEVLAMQGKQDAAIQKYREAIKRPRTHDTYDRARLDAYVHLIALLKSRKDLDSMDALYRQRIAEFGSASCHGADYAWFLLEQRGDTANAISVARKAIAEGCTSIETRQVLGMAHYVAWAGGPSQTQAESLNQARTFLPAGPLPLYLLCSSDRTADAARRLVASGEKIDQKDNNKLTALAYALRDNDLAAARRLLKLGARPDVLVGNSNMPVAFWPVLDTNAEGIKLMQQFGADYSKLRFNGMTAQDLARRTGNRPLLDALGAKGTDL